MDELKQPWLSGLASVNIVILIFASFLLISFFVLTNVEVKREVSLQEPKAEPHHDIREQSNEKHIDTKIDKVPLALGVISLRQNLGNYDVVSMKQPWRK